VVICSKSGDAPIVLILTVTFFVSRGSDLGFKHDIEGNGRFKESSRLWVSNVFFFNDSGELVSPKIVNL
jgi:hypothetical protein